MYREFNRRFRELMETNGCTVGSFAIDMEWSYERTDALYRDRRHPDDLEILEIADQFQTDPVALCWTSSDIDDLASSEQVRFAVLRTTNDVGRSRGTLPKSVLREFHVKVLNGSRNLRVSGGIDRMSIESTLEEVLSHHPDIGGRGP